MKGVFKRKLKIDIISALLLVLGITAALPISLAACSGISIPLSAEAIFYVVLSAASIITAIAAIIYQSGAFFRFENGILSGKYGFFKRFSFPIESLYAVYFNPRTNILILSRNDGTRFRIRGLKNCPELCSAIFHDMPETCVSDAESLRVQQSECQKETARLARRMRLIILISLLVFIANDLAFSKLASDSSYEIILSLLTLVAFSGVILYFKVRQRFLDNADRQLELRMEQNRLSVYSEPVPANCVELYAAPYYLSRILVCRQQEEYYITVDDMGNGKTALSCMNSDFFDSLEAVHSELTNAPIKLIRRY